MHSNPAYVATPQGLPVAPSLTPTLQDAHIPLRAALLSPRALTIIALATSLGIAAGFIAEILRRLIMLVTNISFYQRFSITDDLPAGAVPHLDWWVIPIPVIGGIIVGIMARFGSR